MVLISFVVGVALLEQLLSPPSIHYPTFLCSGFHSLVCTMICMLLQWVHWQGGVDYPFGVTFPPAVCRAMN